jgi:hypothetical protein
VPFKAPMFGSRATSVPVRQIEKDEIDRLYDTRRWKRFRQWILRLNPICQRVVDARQCMTFATECHHVVSPRVDPSRFIDATNVLMLCKRHHPKTQGEDFTKGHTYLPTVTE